MEKALLSDKDISFKKLFHDYFVKGEEFKQLIEEKMPEKLANNRVCAIHLVYSLKVLFDEWTYRSVYELVDEARPAKGEEEFDTMNPIFLENVQGIIGGGINASRITHCPAKVTSGPIFMYLSC